MIKWLTFFIMSATLSTTSYGVETSLQRAATDVGVPYKLLKAICYAESRLKPHAVAYGDGGGSNHAIGMCQVLITSAKSMGWEYDSRCRTKMRWSNRSYKTCTLFGPYTNAYWSARILKVYLNKYGNSWIHATAAYNAGSVKTCRNRGYYTYTKSDGSRGKIKCRPGGLMNQKYVDRVMEALSNDKP